VAPVEAEETANGFRIRADRTVDWERQAEVAVEAFEHQAFFVFVDGTQVDALDDEVALGADSEVRFLRLTPLVGG
jgi:queuine/archaeosine tRNA-ribosyltransferase